MNTSNLWQKDTYSQIPNELIGWILREAKSPSEISILLLIARLSSGFHRQITFSRLSQDDFARELRFSKSTASREIRKLIAKGRIFRSSPQGDHYFYSIHPIDETKPAINTNETSMDAIPNIANANDGQNAIASMQLKQDGNRPPNLNQILFSPNKALKKERKKGFKKNQPIGISAVLGIKTSFRKSKPPLLKGISNENLSLFYKTYGFEGAKRELAQYYLGERVINNLREEDLRQLSH